MGDSVTATSSNTDGSLVTERIKLTGTTVAILGGTGPQGRGLARRFAAAGVPVVIGSRSAERAEETATMLATATGGRVRGLANADAAEAGDVVVVAVPWDGHGDLLREVVAQAGPDARS